MSFSVDSGPDKGAAAAVALSSERLPPWGDWALDQAGQASDIVVCGNGAGPFARAVLERGLAPRVHVIETDPLMIASGGVDGPGMTRWEGVNAFTTAFPELEGAESLGVILISGCSASSGALLKALNDQLAYVVVAVDFIGSRATRRSVLTPDRLVASLGGFSVTAYERMGRTDCMALDREFDDGQEGVPATEAMRALIDITEGLAREQVKRLRSEARKTGRELKRVRT